MRHVVTVQDGVANVVTVVTGDSILQAVAGYHPNFTLILDRLSVDGQDESVIDLFDIETTVRNTFNQLTERVTIRGDEVFVDGDSRGGAIARQILRAVENGQTDKLDSLVNFMEKVESNPEPHSREQLFDWLDKHEFTITTSGDIVGYKGVRKDEAGDFFSISSGPAVVNGEQVNGYVPNPIGAVVEMPRSQVHHDPQRGCASGLHVGTWQYARGFARGAVLEVHVNPRDVVSVPTDCNWQKVRTCRYKVVGVLESNYTAPIVKVDDDDNTAVEVKATTPEPVKVGRVTDNNHKAQKRYPSGTYRNGQNVSGRFIPRNSLDYHTF